MELGIICFLLFTASMLLIQGLYEWSKKKNFKIQWWDKGTTEATFLLKSLTSMEARKLVPLARWALFLLWWKQGSWCRWALFLFWWIYIYIYIYIVQPNLQQRHKPTSTPIQEFLRLNKRNLLCCCPTWTASGSKFSAETQRCQFCTETPPCHQCVTRFISATLPAIASFATKPRFFAATHPIGFFEAIQPGQ